ncbi:uncharacterized protein LOC111175065 [Delphinapterus leucas]|uniref:Uncharacterized protein LOC111175065 n=1 Tax=Delphinapterus leucas TaxID=9749 RepID=A0A2Y9NF44_DELLE|nr:uncharacterized protein LOC111175065 [Delphinapterus leucas]
MVIFGLLVHQESHRRSRSGTARARRPRGRQRALRLPGRAAGRGARVPACASRGGREVVRASPPRAALPRGPARRPAAVNAARTSPARRAGCAGCAALSEARSSPPPAPPLLFVRARRPEGRPLRPGGASASGRRVRPSPPRPPRARSGGGGLGGAGAR